MIIDGLVATSEEFAILGLTILAVLLTLWLFTRPQKGRKQKWFPYLSRGLMAVAVAASLTQQLIAQPEKGSTFPVYLGYYFLLNGVVSLQAARSTPENAKGTWAAIASSVGGLWLIIAYPFNVYHRIGVATNLGRFIFSTIVIVIGILQVQGAVRMTPQPIVKHANLIFGFLEIVLGMVVIAAPIDWQANAVALVWTALVSIYMFFVAHRLHNM